MNYSNVTTNSASKPMRNSSPLNNSVWKDSNSPAIANALKALTEKNKVLVKENKELKDKIQAELEGK